jgi:hypothetical protein
LHKVLPCHITCHTKYYLVKWHFFWNAVRNGEVTVLKVDTLHHGADYLMKGLLVKPLNGSARLIKDGKQQTSQVVLLDLLLGIVWLLLFVIF